MEAGGPEGAEPAARRAAMEGGAGVSGGQATLRGAESARVSRIHVEEV